MRTGLLATAALLMGLSATPALAGDASHDKHVSVRAADLQWHDAVSFEPGAKAAVVYGDPTKAGPFVLRLSVPADFKIAPHWHSQAEAVTVLSGRLHFGVGDTYDLGIANEFVAGDFFYAPAGHRHFVHSEEATVVELHGNGPFDINYVNPADDPRTR